MNSEQMTKTMENFIHYVLINNLKQLCEQIISDNDFPKMYNYTTELNTLNTLRKEFTICYRTIMSKTKNDFSNCELTDFKFLCYLGLKVTSQLIKIDRSLQNINLKRKLKICDLSEMLFIKTYHLPIERLTDFPVMYDYENTGASLLYTFVGVLAPLSMVWIWLRGKKIFE